MNTYDHHSTRLIPVCLPDRFLAPQNREMQPRGQQDMQRKGQREVQHKISHHALEWLNNHQNSTCKKCLAPHRDDIMSLAAQGLSAPNIKKYLRDVHKVRVDRVTVWRFITSEKFNM